MRMKVYSVERRKKDKEGTEQTPNNAGGSENEDYYEQLVKLIEELHK